MPSSGAWKILPRTTMPSNVNSGGEAADQQASPLASTYLIHLPEPGTCVGGGGCCWQKALASCQQVLVLLSRARLKLLPHCQKDACRTSSSALTVRSDPIVARRAS
jgi:hypothetical protein